MINVFFFFATEKCIDGKLNERGKCLDLKEKKPLVLRGLGLEWCAYFTSILDFNGI